MDELKSSGRPFDISKWEVLEAYRKVKANRGAPGVDEVTLGGFEEDLKNNLYKIWNRMSAGSYFPPTAPSCLGYDRSARFGRFRIDTPD